MVYPTEIFDLILSESARQVLNADLKPNRIEYDTRRIIKSSNTLFVAINSIDRNGSDYIIPAFEKGVRNFLVNSIVDLPEEIVSNSNLFYVDDTLAFLHHLAKIQRSKFEGKVVGITGSRGKTIIKEYLFQILVSNDIKVDRSPRSFNSILGIPLSILSMNLDVEYWLIEAGISKSGEMKLAEEMIQPKYGILTKMGNDHAEGFNSAEEKLKEKIILFNSSKWFLGEASDVKEIESKRLVRWNAKHNFNEDLLKSFFEALELNINLDIHQQDISAKWSIREGVRSGEIILDQFGNDIKSIDVALGFLVSRSQGKKNAVLGPLSKIEQKYEIELIQQFSQLYNIQFYLIGWNNQVDNIENVKCFNSNEALIDYLTNINLDGSDFLLKAESNYLLEVERYLDANIHHAYISIDLDAIRHNVKFLRRQVKDETKIMAMVKAESYGAGSEEIGIFLQEEGVDYFGVAYLTEAIALRKRGITIPILVMNIDADFDLAIKYQLEVLIYSKRQLNQFIKVLEKKQIKSYPIQLKVETGMYRLGFTYDEVVAIMPILNSDQIELKAIMSHLRASDEVIDQSHVSSQIDQFEAIYELFKGEEIGRHILNTSGILNYSSYQYDMVRIGIGILGIDPSDSFSKVLIPALNVHAKLIQVKAIKTGDYIGYGIANRAKKDGFIGIINIGYADGIDRRLGNGNWQVEIESNAYPTIGNICMDFTIIDVGDNAIPEGSEVNIYSPTNNILSMSALLNTIPYEVMTSFAGRLSKKYMQE